MIRPCYKVSQGITRPRCNAIQEMTRPRCIVWGRRRPQIISRALEERGGGEKGGSKGWPRQEPWR